MIPRFPKRPGAFALNGINRVRIELNAQDQYDVTFSRCRGIKVFHQSRAEAIGCEQLRSVFTESSGLEVTLFPSTEIQGTNLRGAVHLQRQ